MNRKTRTYTATNGQLVENYSYLSGGIETTNVNLICNVGPCRIHFLDWHIYDIQYADVEINKGGKTWTVACDNKFKLGKKGNSYYALDDKCNKQLISRDEFNNQFQRLTGCTLDEHNSFLQAAWELNKDATMPYF